MKKTKKVVLAFILAALIAVAMFAFPACSSGGVIDTKITGSYVSDVRTTYYNNRPGYNYYMFTSDYQTLYTYEDGTYCLAVSSTIHTGIILTADDLTADDTEEFSSAKSNPRATSLKYYYGNFTDAGASGIKLSMPFRIIAMHAGNEGDAEYHVDTAAWTDNMKKALKQTNQLTGEYLIPEAEWNLEGYWRRYAFKETTLGIDSATGRLKDRVTFGNGTQTVIEANEVPAAPTLSDKSDSPATAKIKGAYMGSVPRLVYSGSGSDYKVEFNFQTMIAYADGTYNFSTSSVAINNLKLDKSGNGYAKTAQASVLNSYFGKYESKANDFDSDTLNVTLKKPERIVSAIGSNTVSSGELGGAAGKYIDTKAWTDAMGDSASKYLESNAFGEIMVPVTLSSSGFLYTDMWK